MVPRPQKITTSDIFTRRPAVRWLIIFAVALVSRLIFLTQITQLPVFWDARIYTSAAIGLLGYADRGGEFARGESSSEEYFQYYHEYLAGEDIDWLYYNPPTLTEAQKYLFYSGPVYPAIMAGIFMLPWSNDFQAVRYFNAFIDALTLLIMTIIVHLLWRKRWLTITAAIIQILYIPAIITCGILSLETITSFFIALLLLAVLIFYCNESRLAIIAAGIIGGILFLTKPTAALLSAPVLMFLIIIYWKRWKFLLKTGVFYLVPFLLMALPWTIYVSNYYGKPAIRDPEYSSANLRSSSAIEFEGYDLDYTDPDFWTYPALRRVLHNPLGYLNLLSKKVIRMWWTPHDEFRQGPQVFETIYHRLIIIAGLLGLAVAIARWRRFALLAVLMALYYASIHAVFHAVPRYNFNALPAVFLLLPCLLYAVYRVRSYLLKKRKLIAGIVAICGLVLIVNSDALAESIYQCIGIITPLVLTIIGLLAIGWLAGRLLRGENGSKMLMVCMMLPFFLLSVTTITGWTRPQLGEWYTSLGDPGETAVTEISFPHNLDIASGDKVSLLIDMATFGAGAIPVEFNIDGLRLSFIDGGESLNKTFFNKGSYKAFVAVMNLNVGQQRWYRRLTIPTEQFVKMVAPDGVLKVGVSLGAEAPPGSALRVYGGAGSTSGAEVPSFDHTSIERFKEWGDRRIYESYRFSSRSANSYLIGGNAKSGKDLSEACGNQLGRYRMYVIISRGGDYMQVYY